MKNISMNKQSGAVSLFVVIFFMLLVTVVTVSFLRLMVGDQQQATNNDLSQSAYDSAQAGVEDAKRALLKYRADCFSSPGTCAGAANAISEPVCNAALEDISGIGETANGKPAEIMVQQSSGDKALDQAYTCVTIILETDDYVGDLAANQSQLVPLISEASFDRVLVEWFSKEDISTSGSTAAVSLDPISTAGQPLYKQGQWPLNRPSLMRAQLIQFAKTFTLANFDTVSGAQSNGATAFLYPTAQVEPEIVMTANDQRKTSSTDDPNPKDPSKTPAPVRCESTITSGGFACSATLVLPQAIGDTVENTDRTAFLRLTPLYNATHFKVTLWKGTITSASVPVKFKDVQPEIDSTGRANDLFRRVQSRVDLFDTSFPYPDAAIDLTGNFCKDFSVTDTEYIATPSCTP